MAPVNVCVLSEVGDVAGGERGSKREPEQERKKLQELKHCLFFIEIEEKRRLKKQKCALPV